jgi:hypothetical protein
MHAKLCIVGWILLHKLCIDGKAYAYSAPTATPATEAQESTVQWRTTPKDTALWRREPFKNIEGQNYNPSKNLKQGTIGVFPEFSLQGIMKSNGCYYAIINGSTVKSGDRLNEWTIAGISRHRVTIRRNNEKQIYDIYQGRIERGTR